MTPSFKQKVTGHDTGNHSLACMEAGTGKDGVCARYIAQVTQSFGSVSNPPIR